MALSSQATPDVIEELLEEARALSPPHAWERVEEAVRRLVRLYGAGLGRVIEHARTAGVIGPTFDTLLAEDELLSHLLVLHALHPRGTEERVRRALDTLHSEAGLDVALVGIIDDVAYLEATELPDRSTQALIRRIVDAAAPELSSIEIAAMAA